MSLHPSHSQSSHVAAPSAPSAETLEQLSISLQQQLPKQTGTLIMDHDGAVLASSGDLKEVGERVSRSLLTLLQDANGLFVHSQTTERSPIAPVGGREELARITSQTQSSSSDSSDGRSSCSGSSNSGRQDGDDWSPA